MNRFSVESALRFTAGIVVLVSVALAHLVSMWWCLLTVFVGLNLLQSSLTNWCPAVWLFEKIGLQRCQRVGPMAERRS